MGHAFSICSISCGNIASQQLESAIREGDVDLLERMIDEDPERLSKGLFYDRQTPLHVAAWHGQLEVLSMLLDRGADANPLNRNGQTPLMLACKHGHSTCIDPLVKAGANILGFEFTCGRTCLHLASRGGHTECVSKILDAARRGPVSQSWGLARLVNVRDCQCSTALHLASRMGHVAVVRLLLDSGAIVSCTNTTVGNGPGDGSSPIHFAARGGSVECVKELLAWGANRNERDIVGLTPYLIAMKHYNTACAALLNPRTAEPLVWPSPWKFMSEGELEPEAKTVLEAALAEANCELNKEIEVQVSRKKVRKASSRRKYPTLALMLAMPERRVDVSSPLAQPSATAFPVAPTLDTPTEEARVSVAGEFPGGDLSSVNPNSGDTESIGALEMCCICFEHFCTIEVMECGHQMCATCTLSLCCHNKPNPAMPFSPPPSCPFCRHSIGHLILARPKSSKLADTKEHLKRKLRRSRSSRDGSGGKGSFTGSIFSKALGGSKRLGSSGRFADADRGGSKRLGASARIADADCPDSCGIKRLGASAIIADVADLVV